MTKYSDLIQFDPIETVIQLTSADEEAAARQLVRTYVFSDTMVERLTAQFFPQIQFDDPQDHKGILVVGNYGTGKSHLMSALSAIAENKNMLDEVQHPAIKEGAATIAGKFKVSRGEIGGVKKSVRDIVIDQLEESLANWGIDYTFPSQLELSQHKNAFEEMMDKFHEKFPDQGLLFMLDELLDHLRTRQQQEIILDFGFMREIGEVVKDMRFRFVAGVQEALFDTTTFQFVADSLRRVHERFEQFSIVRSDISFVVSERLLKKNDEQKAIIREHLNRYSKFYGDLNEKIEDYVNLFPIHPAYISTLEKISVIEKRVVLRTFSDAMKALLNNELKPDEPGLVAYDNYWQVLCSNPTYRTVPDVKTVIDVANTLQGRIDSAFTRPQYKPMAKRIVEGLSIHRLTHGDIEVPLGATAEELRDELCLFDPMIAEMGGDEVAEDMRTHVETVMREIVKTVSGQFITNNEDNHQFYLDLKKNIDFDALIQKKAETLDDSILDQYYFTAMRQVILEDPTQKPHAVGFSIWEYELPWKERNAPRQGYLFFGAPNQRSTAVPSRDYYLYFIPPFDKPKYKDDKLEDEIFFKLKNPSEGFRTILCSYAAAVELEKSASGHAKKTYGDKAGDFLRKLVRWLNDNLANCVEVTFNGSTKTILNWAKGQTRAGDSIRDIIVAVSSGCLSTTFESDAKDYPHFSKYISSKRRKDAAKDTLRHVSGSSKTQESTAVLDALGLLDGETLTTSNSKYAKWVTDLLNTKGAGQVCNHDELVADIEDVPFSKNLDFRLEEEWVLVLLGALVYSGEVVLSVPGKKFTAAELSELSVFDFDSLINFKHIEKPKDWNISGLKALFELLGLPPGFAQLVTQNKAEPVQELQMKMSDFVDKLVTSSARLNTGLTFWGKSLIPQDKQDEWKKNMDDTKSFFESLQTFNTPGKLKNFKYSDQEVKDKQLGLSTLKDFNVIEDLFKDLTPQATYLAQAQSVLPLGHAMIESMSSLQKTLLDTMENIDEISKPNFRQNALSQMNDQINGYIKEYLSLHKKHHLDHAGDKRKNKLINDERFAVLKKLASIPHMPAQDLNNLKDQLADLPCCWNLTEDNLKNSPVCPHDGFRPADTQNKPEAKLQLDHVDQSLDKMVENWTKQLLSDLDDPTVSQSIKLLTKKQQTLINDAIKFKRLPDPVSEEFIDAVREALSNLQQIKINLNDLKETLNIGDGPSTVEEMLKRMKTYLSDKTKGVDPEKVRIVIE